MVALLIEAVKEQNLKIEEQSQKIADLESRIEVDNMAVEFGSNFISGVTTATSDTDAAYKQYADTKPGYALTTTAVGGEFYKGNVSTGTTTVGLSSSLNMRLLDVLIIQ